MDNHEASQQMFNKVVTHLRQQGRKAHNSGGNCCYRTASGLKCAVGCLIPEDKYKPSMEGNGVNYLLNRFPELKKFIPNYEIAAQMQEVHDSYTVNQWETKFADIAKMYNLTLLPTQSP